MPEDIVFYSQWHKCLYYFLDEVIVFRVTAWFLVTETELDFCYSAVNHCYI